MADVDNVLYDAVCELVLAAQELQRRVAASGDGSAHPALFAALSDACGSLGETVDRLGDAGPAAGRRAVSRRGAARHEVARTAAAAADGLREAQRDLEAARRACTEAMAAA